MVENEALYEHSKLQPAMFDTDILGLQIRVERKGKERKGKERKGKERKESYERPAGRISVT